MFISLTWCNKYSTEYHTVKPKLLTYYEEDGTTIKEKQKSKKSRNINTQTTVLYYIGEKIIEKTWFKDKTKHRIDGPAYIVYIKNGRQIEREVWYNNGKEHRSNEPSSITYYHNGNVHYEWWYQYGEIRQNGPGFVIYYENGNIHRKCWYENNILHRTEVFR